MKRRRHPYLLYTLLGVTVLSLILNRNNPAGMGLTLIVLLAIAIPLWLWFMISASSTLLREWLRKPQNR